MAVRKISGAWWVDFRHEYKRYRKRSPLDTKAGAHAYEVTLRGRLARGEPIDGKPAKPPCPTFETFCASWYETQVLANDKPSEQRTKRMILRAHLLPWFERMRLDQITIAEIAQYKAEKIRAGLAAKTVNNHLGVLGAALRDAVEWGILDSRPRIKHLKFTVPPIDFLTGDEQAALLSDRREPTWNLMVLVALSTGMRQGELLALDWSKVDFDHNIITVSQSLSNNTVTSTKTHRIRYLPINPSLRAALLPCAESSGFVFSEIPGRHFQDDRARKAIRRITRRVGMRYIGWHTLRHTYATNLASGGMPLHLLRDLMGHSKIEMTLRYTHFAPSLREEAARAVENAHLQWTAIHFGQPVGTHGANHAEELALSGAA